MRFAEGKRFVDFQVQLNEELFPLHRCRQIVDSQAHFLSDGTNRFKQVLALGSAGLRVHHDVGGHDFADPPFDGVTEGVDLF